MDHEYTLGDGAESQTGLLLNLRNLVARLIWTRMSYHVYNLMAFFVGG